MYRWPSAKVCGAGSVLIRVSAPKVTKVTWFHAFFVTLWIANTVREPAVEERLIGWPALGETEVTLALERLERAQEDGFAAGFAAKHKKAIERGERLRADAPVGDEVGIVATIAVERSERALEEGDGDRRAHVDAGVEQLGGDARAARGDLVEAGTEPVEALVDRCSLLARELAHRLPETVRPGNRFGDPEAGRPALVGGMVHIAS